MSKQIIPRELAEIVTALLVSPELIGELDSHEQHQEFIREIGETVARHCGGQVNGVSGDFGEQMMLSVSPNDALPDIADNVWSLYDPTGWEDELGGEDEAFANHAKLLSRRQELLIALTHGIGISVPFVLADESQEHESRITGKMDCRYQGIAIGFQGYSDASSKDHQGQPILIEYHDNRVNVRVYGDINSEEPTAVITLSGAKNEARIEKPQRESLAIEA